MEHAYMVLEALTLLDVLFVVGFCGLLMCRAMLLSPTASSLRREAGLSITRQESFSCLNSHQQARGFLALSESAPRQDASTHPGRSPGSPIPQIRRLSAPLDTSINWPQGNRK